MIISKTQKIYAIRYDASLGDCAICHEKLVDVCMECRSAENANCPLATGECGHKFHQHCLNSWLESNGTCPLCACKWK
jgi:hypothetical protein